MNTTSDQYLWYVNARDRIFTKKRCRYNESETDAARDVFGDKSPEVWTIVEDGMTCWVDTPHNSHLFNDVENAIRGMEWQVNQLKIELDTFRTSCHKTRNENSKPHWA